MGVCLLKKNGNVAEEDVSSDIFLGADRLAEDEVKKFQNKLARAIVVFLELLHLLIARNRDLLLSVIKKKELPSVGPIPPTAGVVRAQTSSIVGQSFITNPRIFPRRNSNEGSEGKSSGIGRSISEDPSRNRLLDDRRSQVDDHSYSVASSFAAGSVRTDSATLVAVQSELQRSFIALTKTLYPSIAGIMQSETPRWLKQCCLENYFSLGTYRQTRLRKLFLFSLWVGLLRTTLTFLSICAEISEELSFSTGSDQFQSGQPMGKSNSGAHPPMAEYLSGERNATESPSASVAGNSVFSRASGKYDL